MLLHAELVCVCPVVRWLSLYALVAAGRRRRLEPFRWSLMRDWSGGACMLQRGPGSRRVDRRAIAWCTVLLHGVIDTMHQYRAARRARRDNTRRTVRT